MHLNVVPADLQNPSTICCLSALSASLAADPRQSCSHHLDAHLDILTSPSERGLKTYVRTRQSVETPMVNKGTVDVPISVCARWAGQMARDNRCALSVIDSDTYHSDNTRRDLCRRHLFPFIMHRSVDQLIWRKFRGKDTRLALSCVIRYLSR